MRLGAGRPVQSSRTEVWIVAVGGLGLLVGLAFRWISPFFFLGIIGAAALLYTEVERPEIPLLGILVATSSIIFENRLPMVSVGPISLHLPDLLLLGSLGIVAVRVLAAPGVRFVRTPLDVPLLAFFGLTVLSTVLAVNRGLVEGEAARREFRTLSYYLAFFIVTNLVRKRRQIEALLNGIFVLSTLVAGGMILQFLVGDSVQIMPGRVEGLGTQGSVFDDITRILPPGWSIVLISFVALACILVLEGLKASKGLILASWGLMGIALLLTFLRSYWAALVAVLAVALIVFRGEHRRKILRWGLIGGLSGALVFLVLASDPNSRATRLLDASVDRFGTLVRGGTFKGEDSSLNWRMIENKYAAAAIAERPILGSGMGSMYRPWDRRLDPPRFRTPEYDFRFHIHNGHLKVMVQSGWLGYLSLMSLSLLFLCRGFKLWRRVADHRLKGTVLGFTLAYLGVLIAAVANSTFTQWRWTPVLGIMMGLNEVILRAYGKDAGTD